MPKKQQRKTKLSPWLRAVLVGLLAAWALFASEHRGQVKFGGLPVPGATVTATQGDKRLTAVTDMDGAYSFADLPDGQWTIRVEMQCFSPIEREIAVDPAAPSPVWDLKLLPFEQIKASAPPPPATPSPKPETAAAAASPAPAAPTVSAAAAAPAPAPGGKKPKKSNKQEETATNGAAPANGQNGFQRADLNASADGSRLTDSGAGTAEMNQGASDGFLVNGSVNNGAASNFAQSPAFGNYRRGARSLYNGNLGVTLDNSYLDARPYSLTGQDTPRQAYNHLTAMGSFGGPLQLGHLWRQSQPNFAINYQWTRNRNADTLSKLVPDSAQRAGDLSAGLPAIDPTTGALFPGSQIPQNRISPQALALLRFYPLPNLASGGPYNYQVPVVGVNTQNSLQSRLSKTIGSKDQLFGMFSWQQSNTQNSGPNIFNFRDISENSGINGTLNWSHRFGQRIFTRLTYNYNRGSTHVTPYFANLENVSAEAGITGNNQDPLNWGPPSLSFANGLTGLSDQQEQFIRTQANSLLYNMFWNHRSHNITYGFDAHRIQINALQQQNPRGAFSFTGAATAGTSNGTAIHGSDFADFLLGIPDTSSIAFGNPDKYFRTTNYAAYFTDDWRISSSFTLNAGLRWEYSSPIVEKYGRIVNLDIAPGYSAVSPVVASTPTGALTGRRYPDSLLEPDKTAFQPRIGVAWRPLPASSLVIRAGYGVTYNTSVYTTIAFMMAQQSPLSKSLSVANSAADPLTLANGFNVSPNVTTNTFAIDPNFRVGYAQTWNAIVQRDLPGSMVATLTYIGTKGTRQPQEFLPNTYPAGASNPCPNCPAGYAYMTSNGNSNREAGQLQLRRRLHSGFTATLQYTFAKAIDDAAVGGGGGGGRSGQAPIPIIAQDWLNLAGERGLSNFDQRHLMSLQLQYTTGMGLHGGTLLSGWRGTLIKGWTVMANITAGSGLPLTPVYVSAVTGTGVTGTLRPEYTGQPLYAAPSGLALSPAAYMVPLKGQWGNAGRDSIVGPNRFSFDSSMERTFRVSDRFSADVRMDSTNTFNHVTFAGWNTTLGNAQYGLPVSPNPMRAMKATFRLRF